MSDYKILRVNDMTDSYYTKKKDIFDLPFRLLIVGKSFLSGKSTVILNLLLREKFFKNDFKGENIFIISNNAMDNKMRILKTEKDVDAHNFMEFSESNLEAVYEEVEERALQSISEGKKPANSLIVIDDVAFSGGLKEKMNGTLSRIFCNGRHINLSVIVTAQKHSQLSTTMRANASGAILFSNSMNEVEAMAQDFNYLESKKEFVKLFREATKKRNSFLVVNFSEEGIYQDSEFKPL
tara:strand:- start:1692 stop:2405 length:714 start_codon:yes stop_codon:yes gene_type:complete